MYTNYIHFKKHVFTTRQGQLWGGENLFAKSVCKNHIYVYIYYTKVKKFAIYNFQFPPKTTFFCLLCFICIICIILYIFYLFYLLHFTKTTKKTKTTKIKKHEIPTILQKMQKTTKNACNNFFSMVLYRYLATKRPAKS